MVYPKESEWFQELTEFMQVEPLEKNAFYQSGLIGFKELNEEDFVQFISIVRDHLDFSDLDTTNNQHLCPIPTLWSVIQHCATFDKEDWSIYDNK